MTDLVKSTSAAGLAQLECGPLADLFRSLRDHGAAPIGYSVARAALPRAPRLGEVRFVTQAVADLSGDREHFFFSHVCSSRANLTEAHIDFWSTRPLKLERTLKSTHLARRITFHRYRPRPNFETGCLLPGARLAIGMATGELRVVSQRGQGIVARARIGGSVNSLCCSNTLLAASVFPDHTGGLGECCGVKLYSVDALLNGRFEAVDFIPAREFGFTPYAICFNAAGTELICSGGTDGVRMRLLTRVYDLKSHQCTTLLDEVDDVLVHAISKPTTDGNYVLVGQQEVCWRDASHQVYARHPRSDELRHGEISAVLAPDAATVFLERAGCLYALSRDDGRLRALLQFGHVNLIGCPDEHTLLLCVRHADCYHVMGIDTRTLQPAVDSHPGAIIDPIIPNGYDIASDGTLCIADRSDKLRLFSPDMRPTATVSMGRGPLAEVLADPATNRVASLTRSGAILTLTPKVLKPESYVACSSGAPVDAGSGRRRLTLSRHTQRFWLRLRLSATDISDEADGVRCCVAKEDEAFRVVRFDDYDWSKVEWTTHSVWDVDAPVRAMSVLRKRVLVLLDDNSLLAVDPQRVTNAAGRQKLPVDGADWCRRLRCTLPQDCVGIAPVRENSIAVWSRKRLALVQLSDDWQALSDQTAACDDIFNVKHDRANARLVVASRPCLRFLSMNLEEMWRLYLLPEGHVIHVLYPQKLRTGLNLDHPGYWWSGFEEAYDLWEVVDVRGRLVRDDGQRLEYLNQYRNRFLVELALSDYRRFEADLGGRAATQDRTPLSLRLLPAALARDRS